MFSVSVSFNTKKATSGLKKSIDQAVRLIATDLHSALRNRFGKITPVRSGRARDSWRLRKKSKSNFEVRSSVPYMERLEQGYSKQAPRGMTRPALREVITRNRSRRIK